MIFPIRKALFEQQQDATLLSAPYNIMAQRAGFINLGKAVDILGIYQRSVAAARRDWADRNADKMIAFIRAGPTGHPVVAAIT